MTRKELIRKLLLTGHLSVPERRMFDQEPIRFNEAKEIIKMELERHKFFPPITDQWDNNRFYNDGLVIERRDPYYILHEQASGATMNLIFDNEEIFKDVDQVIGRYLRQENLDIDGIRIQE